MNASSNPDPSIPRAICILVAALGGEGGGVLAEWLVEAARLSGFYAQSTSIPGVAQRTGATTYYIEVFPVPISQLGDRRPVLSLSAVPGAVDLLVASELLEAVRHLQNGFVTPDRTTLIMSTHRAWTTLERMPPGDGRYDVAPLIALATAQSRQLMGFDMAALAEKLGTVPSALMLGAIAASALLPFERAVFEQVIRASGKGVSASLAGFAAAWQRTAQGGVTLPAAKAPPPVQLRAEVASFPAALHETLTRGLNRVEAYQDAAYGALYLERVARVYALDAKHDRHPDSCRVALDAADTAQHFMLTRETARYLALWMSFDDPIRVADLKCRRSRFERVRKDVKAGPGDLLQIVDYFKPGVAELAGLLPPTLANALLAWDRRRQTLGKPAFAIALHLCSTSFSGFIRLRCVAALRRLRRYGARYQEEQVLITQWLDHVCRAAEHNWALAYELALCARLIKGYGDTNQRGKQRLSDILQHVRGMDSPPSASNMPEQFVRKARASALADAMTDPITDISASKTRPACMTPARVQAVIWHGRNNMAKNITKKSEVCS